MANILSRVMSEARAEQFVTVFFYVLTMCVFGFLAIVTLLR